MASDKTSEQLRGRSMSTVLYSVAVPLDFVYRQVFFAAVRRDSVISLISGLGVIWVCNRRVAFLSHPLHTQPCLTIVVVQLRGVYRTHEQ